MERNIIEEDLQGPPLDDFELTRTIANGTFGKVSRYERKVPLEGEVEEGRNWIAVRSRIVREADVPLIHREIDILSRLQNEYIVEFLGAEVVRNVYYTKMELANANLDDLKSLNPNDVFSSAEVAYFAYQILSGLSYLHKNFVTHRDLKPTNILVFWKDDATFPQTLSIKLKLGGFDLSRFVPEDSASTTTVGTRMYMAPEVALAFRKKERFTGDYMKADVFSVGAMLYELLFGRRPYSHYDGQEHEDLHIPERRGYTNDAENEVLDGIKHMLMWVPDERCDAEDAQKQFMPKTPLMQGTLVVSNPEEQSDDPMYEIELQGPPLNHYEQNDEIGTGSSGKVCRYEILNNEGLESYPSQMAVKLMLRGTSFGYNDTDELGIMMRLSHENIVKVLGGEIHNAILHIKMELAKTDLSQLKIALKIERFSASEVRHLACQVLSGLCYLHKKSIVHRDMKPANVLAFWDHEYSSSSLADVSSVTLKLTDFGLSSVTSRALTRSAAVGTRSYMAPEVAQAFTKQEEFTGDYMTADVFSAGVIIYELLHVVRPFKITDLLQNEDPIISVWENDNESHVMLSSIQEMIEWNPLRRCTAQQALYQFQHEITEPQSQEIYSSLFLLLGLSNWFCQTFCNRKMSMFGESESDLGWIRLVMEEIYKEAGAEAFEQSPVAQGLEKLGYESNTASTYAGFITDSLFRDSESLLDWALLKIDNSGLFDYYTGYFKRVSNGSESDQFGQRSDSSSDHQSHSCGGYNIGVHFMDRLIFRGSGGGTVHWTEFETKIQSMEVRKGHSLWFHGTTSKSVHFILRNGILLGQGRDRRDFSTNRTQGFYVCDNAIYARSYCQQRHDCHVSVIIFQIRDDFVESAPNGLDLRFPYNRPKGSKRPNREYVAREHWGTLEEWENVINRYRSLTQGRRIPVDSKDFIVGPVSDNDFRPTLRFPPSDGLQLCIRTDDLAEELFGCITDIVHFTM